MGEDLVRRAIERRRDLLEQLSGEGTDCYRLFHGVAEGRPGLTIDRYGPILLLQTWREPLTPAEIGDYHRVVEDACGWSLTPAWNHRADKSSDVIAEAEAPVGRELGVRYDVSPRHRGQDPLLFLDLRAGRRLIQDDVILVIRQLAGLPMKGRGARRRDYERFEPRQFDVVVLDPPRWAKGGFGAIDIVRDYPSLLKPALLATAPGGALLATNNTARVDRGEWLRVLQRTAEKCGRALSSVEVVEPEADFPAIDDASPLKMAWLRIN